VACLGRELRGRPIARTVLGVPLALFRDGGRQPRALLDRCPHRNVPLSLGRARDGVLECRYHGWRFDGCGSCRLVPGLVEDDPDKATRRVDAYPTVEQDGLVWVRPTPTTAGSPPDGPPRTPHVDEPGYTTVLRSRVVPAPLLAVLENALDVPHTAFLHRGLFRGRSEPVPVQATVRRRARRVEATYDGEPRPPGLAARALAPGGGVVEHVDRFIAPSTAQVEYRLGPHHLVITTACTPVSDVETALHAAVTFKAPVPGAVARAVVTPIADLILRQDTRILDAQTRNVARFGGERFTNTRIDVLGPHIVRLLRRVERGELDDEDAPDEHVTLWV
jgi:phenylpropionate dioxygenase-like ring-hydroxylating dioxygenase large terminal subunit